MRSKRLKETCKTIYPCSHRSGLPSVGWKETTCNIPCDRVLETFLNGLVG